MMRRPTAFDVVLCIVLFTLVMSALSWGLHQTVPGFIRWLNGVLGANVVTSIMVLAFAVGACFAWWPLFRGWLAKRRGASIRKGK